MNNYLKFKREYISWAAAKGRCFNPKNSRYYSYGGRGIGMCKKWVESFDSFLKDMGPKPTSKHSLDRINNNGNYEPKNCRWATPEEQSSNRRSNVKINLYGREMTMIQFARRLQIPTSSAHKFLRYDKKEPEQILWQILKNRLDELSA